MMRRTSCPNRARALGSDPATSASPPVLANGETSDATKRIFMAGNRRQFQLTIIVNHSGAARGRIHAVVEEGEKVVSRLKLSQPRFMELVTGELVVQPAEPAEVVAKPPVGVGGVGLRLQDERPV